MTPLDLFVIGGALAAIAWVNWYFFIAGRSHTGTRARTDKLKLPEKGS